MLVRLDDAVLYRTCRVSKSYLLVTPGAEINFAKSAATNKRLLRQFVKVDLERQKDVDPIQVGLFDDVRARKDADLVAAPPHPPVLIATVSLVLRQDLDIVASHKLEFVVLLWDVVVQGDVVAVGRAAGRRAIAVVVIT